MGLFDFIFGKKKKTQIATDNEAQAFNEYKIPIEKVHIPTLEMPIIEDYSYMLEDIRKLFGKLYIKLTENYSKFKCDSEMPDGVYFGKTKYTSESNRNGKKEVAFINIDGSEIAKLKRTDWNNYDKTLGADNLNWIGCVIKGTLEVVVAEKFKEEYIKNQLSWIYPRWIKDVKLEILVKAEIEKQDLSTGEFINKKAQREGYDGYFDLDYNNRYIIAGCFIYVQGPFVAVGYAENEPTNPKNPKAMVVKTLDGTKVGYVAERELSQFYDETNGARTPLIIEAHIYNGKLFGNLYTYTDNVEEYQYMAYQYTRLLCQYYDAESETGIS